MFELMSESVACIEKAKAILIDAGFSGRSRSFTMAYDRFFLGIEFQRSVHAAGYYVNLGLYDSRIGALSRSRLNSTEWHACGRLQQLEFAAFTPTALLCGEEADSFDLQVFVQLLPRIIEYLKSACDTILAGAIDEFPLNTLWIRNITREELFGLPARQA